MGSIKRLVTDGMDATYFDGLKEADNHMKATRLTVKSVAADVAKLTQVVESLPGLVAQLMDNQTQFKNNVDPNQAVTRRTDAVLAQSLTRRLTLPEYKQAVKNKTMTAKVIQAVTGEEIWRQSKTGNTIYVAVILGEAHGPLTVHTGREATIGLPINAERQMADILVGDLLRMEVEDVSTYLTKDGIVTLNVQAHHIYRSREINGSWTKMEIAFTSFKAYYVTGEFAAPEKYWTLPQFAAGSQAWDAAHGINR